MSRLVDLKTAPNGRLRYYTLFIMVLATMWPTGFIIFGVPIIRGKVGNDAALKFPYIVMGVELLIQLACFASVYVVPPREAEQGMVETMKKISFLTLTSWCFQCALYLPGSPELYWAECIGGLAIPIVGCWVILRVPHLFVTRYSEADKEDDDLRVRVRVDEYV